MAKVQTAAGPAPLLQATFSTQTSSLVLLGYKFTFHNKIIHTCPLAASLKGSYIHRQHNSLRMYQKIQQIPYLPSDFILRTCSSVQFIHKSNKVSLGTRLSQSAIRISAQLLQSLPALCNPMDCSLPGSSIHGILHARIPQWVAMPSCRESSPTQ